MLSRAEQANLNLQEARDLRSSGTSYRDIGRKLRLTSAQLGLIRRTLKREKAGRTRLRSTAPGAGDRDLLVSRSALPLGLRRQLNAAGFRTLGDMADRLSDTDLPGLETLRGIGPHRVRLITRLLDHYGLLTGPENLRAAIEAIFPELGDEH